MTAAATISWNNSCAYMEYGSDPNDTYIDHTVTVNAEREVQQ